MNYKIIGLGLILCCFSSVQGQRLKRENLDLTELFTAEKVAGAVLVHDFGNGITYSNDYEWANKGHIPASTFKIPNSIIALELDIVHDENTIIAWDSIPRAMEIWNADLTLKEAFQRSCVPCYQEFARKIGLKNMTVYLKKLSYPNMVVTPANLDYFWLDSDSKISQQQQIDFLEALYFKRLPIKPTTRQTMMKIMQVQQTPLYTLSVKTGWGQRSDSTIGWYVGFVETADNIFFFATSITPTTTTDMKKFGEARISLTRAALKQLGVLD